MSKAFVRESGDEDDAPDPEAAAVPAPRKNYMSRAGFDRLKAELRQLVEVERPEVVRTVSWAAANGDRSENGDYIYGKRRLREIDRRVRFLAKRLDIAVVVDPREQKQRKRVFFGATVTVEDDDGRETIARMESVAPPRPVSDDLAKLIAKFQLIAMLKSSTNI